ncbi:hypothetical protein FGO68_gene9241 [Halteria grandinella]|uniref:Uncharacterized protein n=1 Tax=Halteria grandinella TaxID=5974 RepID=A0A8J8T3A2_HALGN|nr:hypothetical protein FGO68_gene9241 [Halteria grandinella]
MLLISLHCLDSFLLNDLLRQGAVDSTFIFRVMFWIDFDTDQSESSQYVQILSPAMFKSMLFVGLHPFQLFGNQLNELISLHLKSLDNRQSNACE